MISADDLKYPEIKKIELGVVSFNSLYSVKQQCPSSFNYS